MLSELVPECLIHLHVLRKNSQFRRTDSDLLSVHSLSTNPDVLPVESGGLPKEHQLVLDNTAECALQGLAGGLGTEIAVKTENIFM